MSEEDRIIKMEEDFSSTVDEKLPQYESLASSGNVNEALDNLLSLEKQTRVACDSLSTGRVLVSIVKILWGAKDLKSLNEQLMFLSKRRGQLKHAISKMVQEAMTILDQIEDKASKLNLLETLRTITAGKIFVEVERARLTRILANIKQSEGNIAEAADVMQELQVETFGSMEKREKVDFILEQMRLCLAKKDYVRAQIVSRKISSKFFEDAAHQDMKIRFYELMIELEQHDQHYVAISKFFRNIFETPSVQQSENEWKQALSKSVMYIVMSPFDNEQSDMLHRLKSEKKLRELPLYQSLLESFTTLEVINLAQFDTTFAELRSTEVFSQDEAGNSRWQDLRKRIVDHNIRVISKYYTRISLERLAGLIELSIDETEKFLSNLVTKKIIYAKIDRPSGIISFEKSFDAAERLNDWSKNISTLMSLVERTKHLIVKEEMVHGIVEV